jgi:hypothetical protein
MVRVCHGVRVHDLKRGLGGPCFPEVCDTDTTQKTSLRLIFHQILHARWDIDEVRASPELRFSRENQLSGDIEKQSEATTTAF